jgi:hypothetical protein
MSGLPTRRRLQIRLSTTLVMALVIGGLLGVNLTPTQEWYASYGSQSFDVNLGQARALQAEHDTAFDGFGHDRIFGWPFEYCNYSEKVFVEEQSWKTVAGSGYFHWAFPGDKPASQRNLVYNILFWVGILISTFTFTEAKRPHSEIPRSVFRIHLFTWTLVVMTVLLLCVWNFEHTYWRDDLYRKGWPFWAFSYKSGQPIKASPALAALNAAVALSITAAVATAGEWLIRRREARAHSQRQTTTGPDTLPPPRN